MPATRIAACCAALLALLAAGPVAAQSAQDLLRRMEEATRRLNYDGVFVYQRGTQIDSMRLVHMFDGDRERERLLSLSGPPREVVRDGARVTCLYADDQAAVVERNPSHDLIGIGFSAPVDSLVDSYGFSLEGSDRIAGREAWVVAVDPLDRDRYAYRLWIDGQTGLLLKSVILGRGGRVLEQVQFTTLSILEQADVTLLEPEITGSGFTWRTDREESAAPAASVSETAWRVEWVPPGFDLKENNVQSMATREMPVGHLVYSDGLAMVSVFIEQLMPDETPLQGFSARGAVNAFSRVADNYQITVVGELPLPTVRQIAASVARTGN